MLRRVSSDLSCLLITLANSSDSDQDDRSGSKSFDSLIVSLKDFLKNDLKLILKKVSRLQKHENYPFCIILTSPISGIIRTLFQKRDFCIL